jgi:hypothetical protein
LFDAQRKETLVAVVDKGTFSPEAVEFLLPGLTREFLLSSLQLF